MSLNQLNKRASSPKIERFGKVTASLLQYVATGALICIAFSSPVPMQKLTGRAYKYLWKKSRKTLSTYMKRRIKELHEAGYVDIQEGSVKLTKAGKKLLERATVESIEIATHEWDHKWRCVAYDVPDALKKQRDLFRRQLGQLGFVQMQKSVFVLPYRCSEEVSLIARGHGIAKFVLFMEANDIPEASKLKKRFGL